MNKELDGKLENLKGRAKQAAGAVTGDKGLEAEGAFDRAKGALQEGAEKVKRQLRGDGKPVDEDRNDEEDE